MASSDTDIPMMPTPTVPHRSLTTFKSLSFDIYGTLINWETSIIQLLSPLLDTLPQDSPYANASTNSAARAAIVGRFHDHGKAIQVASPAMRYDQVLRETYLGLATDCNIPSTSAGVQEQATRFGNSVGDWPPFADTVDAMQRLGKYYKLVPLSNVDRASFARTCAGPLKGVPFWRVYVAEDIGSYKPDARNFEYLLKHLDEDDRGEGGSGISKEQDLMVAQSLYHDHVPCKKMGIASVWIARKGAGAGKGEGTQELHESGLVGYGWRFATLGEFADEVEKQWRAEGKGR